ncbi:MAG TPA: M20/M25/M40 family metallo-hydrolase [Terriglobales bacterium]|nr:M20/M25/M40 family metallo-hydrolase [Terriglobales bacterium]
MASDALNGRGSATHDELVAATYIASELEQYGVAPLGDDGGYLQHVPLERQKPARAPELAFHTSGAAGEQDLVWKHGAEMLLLQAGPAELNGPLQKIQVGEPTPVEKGAFVLFVDHGGHRAGEGEVQRAITAGAVGVMVSETPRYRSHWDRIAQRLFSGELQLPQAKARAAVLVVSSKAFEQLAQAPDSTPMHLSEPMAEPETVPSWNVIGEIRGSDPLLQKKAVLFSAHLDHLGVGAPVNGDNIYNGADDDASGVTAVLELARVLGSRARPRRTVVFALFGSEELGALGSKYFREHPAVPLSEIAANLEFEMIGRPDKAVAPDQLWLTGWERSNLGPALAAHGAKLVGDPHPKEDFFARSDNYELAQKGVVAQTISSYGLHADYHQPSDDIAHLDFKHMDAAIQSLVGPVEWLVNSGFTPEWKPGGKP